MNKTVFDHLRVIRKECESKIGDSDVCGSPDGQLHIRLQIKDSRCQKEYLSNQSVVPVRLNQGILEVLLPYQEGSLLGPWLEQKPNLAQRRDACLSLIAQCLDLQSAPCVLALSAQLKNLRFIEKSACLQLLPNWSEWYPNAHPGNDVAAVAMICRHILTDGYSMLQTHQYPYELQLFCIRQRWDDYQTWGQLQQDLSAIPDCLLPLTNSYQVWAKRFMTWVKQWIKPATCLVVALLVVAALISLWNVYQNWKNQNNESSWSGMVSVGDQKLDDG